MKGKNPFGGAGSKDKGKGSKTTAKGGKSCCGRC